MTCCKDQTMKTTNLGAVGHDKDSSSIMTVTTASSIFTSYTMIFRLVILGIFMFGIQFIKSIHFNFMLRKNIHNINHSQNKTKTQTTNADKIRRYNVAVEQRRLSTQCETVKWDDACERVEAAVGDRRQRRRMMTKQSIINDFFHKQFDQIQQRIAIESSTSFRNLEEEEEWMLSDHRRLVYDDNCLRKYRLQLRESMTFPYYANRKLFTGGNQSMALFVQHGSMRDADFYYCTLRKVLMNYHHSTLSDILVIAPHFNYKDDLHLSVNDTFWNTSKPWGDWRLGAESDPLCCGNTESMASSSTISSFEVLDHMLRAVTNEELYPKLNKIIMLGHSAGGQMIQRYSLVSSFLSNFDNDSDRIKLQFIVANPSSFTYLNNHRYSYNCGECTCNNDECECPEECTKPFHDHTSLPNRSNIGSEWPCYDSKYDYWPYGLSGITNPKYTVPYVVQSNPVTASETYRSRHMVYAVGQNDTCNNLLIECDQSCWAGANLSNEGEVGYCFRSSMDTRCPAMLEGPNRKVRAIRYMKFLNEYYGDKTHELHFVPNVGHNATEMFASEIILHTIIASDDNDVTENDEIIAENDY